MASEDPLGTILFLTNWNAFTSVEFDRKLRCYKSAKWKLPIIVINTGWFTVYHILYIMGYENTAFDADFTGLVIEVIMVISVQLMFIMVYVMTANNYFRSNELVWLLNKLNQIHHEQLANVIVLRREIALALSLTLLFHVSNNLGWQFLAIGDLEKWPAIVMNVLFTLICLRIDMYVILFNCVMTMVKRKFSMFNLLICESRQESELVPLMKLHFEVLSLNGLITRALLTPLAIWMMWSFTECTVNLYVVYDGCETDSEKNIPYVFLSIW